MATPSLAMIPSAYADSKVYSVLPNNGDGDFTFNRDSSATRVGQNGLIQEVGFFGNDLVSNGDFSNGSTDWGLGSNWSVADGKASCDGSASNSMSQASTVGIASTTFKVSYDVLSISQGSIRITLGGVAGASASQTGSYSDFITATSTDRLRIFADSSAIASIDNIIVQQVTGDQPRLNYDISNGVVQSCPSLLLEPASTNLVTTSETLSGYWALQGATLIVDNQAVNPTGSLYANKLNASATGSFKSITNVETTAYDSKTLNVSIFAKKITNDYIFFYNIGSTSGSNGVWFNISNGTLGNIGGGWSNSKIEDYGNGWYRCSATVTFGTNTNYLYIANTDGNGNSTSTVGSQTYLWGSQIEEQSYATSYIPTNGSSQTRAAETCIKENLSSTILNPSYPFSMYAKCDVISTNSGYAITLSNPLVSSQYFTMEYFSNLWHITSRPNGPSIRVSSTTAPTIGTHKVLGIWTQSDMKLYLNGSLIVSGTNNEAWNNAVNGLLLGQLRTVGDTGSRNPIREAQFFKTELTNAQAVTLTTL